MEQASYVIEAFDLFNQVNSHFLKHYFSSLNYALTPKQFLVLELVHKSEPVNVHSIAEQLDLSISSTSQLVSKLENDGYVIRSINPKNRREIFLTLGEKGEEYYAEYNKIDRFVIEKFFSQLSVEETKQLRDIAKKLHQVVTEDQVVQE
ncbi:MarR family winged helix-turn-helix transcriptional regulator [Fictibacillus sp. FJAT-27399]|uniref:MarR family winged helix-turn-helix transcriptional regulator n=1 Tax=Fictibacillus sp. FJAT-27399 TaxID=1729689 RepID=UPI00078061EF|nr:MarR family transcriptional regulator [Fictibacillus sp. FJAT-27399]